MTARLPIFQNLFRLGCAALLALDGTGCALFRGKKMEDSAPPATAVVGNNGFAAAGPRHTLHIPNEGRIGTIKLVGRGGRFVLVETLTGGMLNLPDGQELHCRMNGEPGALATATLRLTQERRQQFASADVAEGVPHAGDAVFVGGPDTVPSSEGHIAPMLLPMGVGGILPPPQGAGR